MAHHTVVGSPAWRMVAHPATSPRTTELFQGPSVSNSHELSGQLCCTVLFDLLGMKNMAGELKDEQANSAVLRQFLSEATEFNANLIPI